MVAFTQIMLSATQMSELCMRQYKIIVIHTILPALHLLRNSELSIPKVE